MISPILFAFAVSSAVGQVAKATGSVLTLAQAEQRALAAAPQLRQARAQVEAADARVSEAEAPLFPQVTATASYQRTFITRAGTVTNGSTLGGRDAFNVGLNASQLVYDFGQTTGKWQVAKANRSAQEETERVTRLTAVANVRLSYLTARAQKELVQVATETLANQDKHLQQIQAFIDVRTRPAIDSAQAKADVANAKVQLIGAENGYATAKATLNQAMGVEGSTDYDLADETVGPVAGEEQPTDALLVEALQTRPEFASLKKQVEAQELSLRATEGGYGPTLSVSTAASEAGPAPNNLSPSWSAGANLSWPIFQGMVTPAQVREGRANLASLQAQSDTLRQQVRLDIEKARLAVRAAKETLTASDDALVNANLRLDLAEGRYSSGVGSIIELGDAQVARTLAAAQRVQAEYGLASARVQLQQAIGRM